LRPGIQEQAVVFTRGVRDWLAAGMVALAGSIVSGQDAVRLEPKYEPGRRTYVEQTSKAIRRMRRDASSQPLEARTETIYGMLALVTAADRDAATVEWTIDRVALIDETPGHPLRFDTDATPASMPQKGPEPTARALLGKKVEMRVARRECQPNAEQVAALRAVISGDESASAVLLDELSLERFRYSWGDARQALFAWRDVRPGEVWENTLRQTATDGSVTVYEYRCKLDAIEKLEGQTVARVSFSGQIRPDGDEAARPNEHGVTMKLDSGRFHGTALFDVERREFALQETSAELRATATTPTDSAGKQQTIRLEQSIESRTTIQPAEARRSQPAVPRKP
jgi:hypothetical protein